MRYTWLILYAVFGLCLSFTFLKATVTEILVSPTISLFLGCILSLASVVFFGWTSSVSRKILQQKIKQETKQEKGVPL